ncbi:MAG: BadF/BadG/BcrA/BcrD ATPase family protein [[Clostridium] scindens]
MRRAKSITLVGEGKPMDEIAAGIQRSVAKRCFVMSEKAGATDSVTLTGGCAKNEGLKKAIQQVLPEGGGSGHRPAVDGGLRRGRVCKAERPGKTKGR